MAPATAPIINAEFPIPRKEISNPAKEPIPAPTTATMIRFAIGAATLNHTTHEGLYGQRMRRRRPLITAKPVGDMDYFFRESPRM